MGKFIDHVLRALVLVLTGGLSGFFGTVVGIAADNRHKSNYWHLAFKIGVVMSLTFLVLAVLIAFVAGILWVFLP